MTQSFLAIALYITVAAFLTSALLTLISAAHDYWVRDQEERS